MATDITTTASVKRFNRQYLSLLLLTMFLFNPAQALELTRIQSRQNQQLELHGQFGRDCKQCEIIVDYGKGLLYAYKPTQWHEKKLTFSIKDLGKSLKVRLFVRTAQGDSNAKTYLIKPRLKPARLSGSPATRTRHNSRSVFLASHNDPFGGKGVDQFNVSTKPAGCNETSDLFHQAKIIIGKKRFGDARIEQQPPSGCTNCKPIKVRWYHEPTGRVEYQLLVQHRQVIGMCPGNKRNR